MRQSSQRESRIPLPKPPRPGVGIGRQAGFRFQCRKACEFESRPGHQPQGDQEPKGRCFALIAGASGGACGLLRGPYTATRPTSQFSDLGAAPKMKGSPRPGGEIGRHKGLKIPRPCGHAGSIPAPGTKVRQSHRMFVAAGANRRRGPVAKLRIHCIATAQRAGHRYRVTRK